MNIDTDIIMTTKKNKQKSNTTVKTPTSINNFEYLDGISVHVLNTNHKLNNYSEDEFNETLNYVCRTYESEIDDWWSISEAISIINDKKIISYGNKPVYSDTLREPILVNLSRKHELVIPDFDKPVVLLREWRIKQKEWGSEIVAIMKNPMIFWMVIEQLCNQNDFDSQFSLPIAGFERQSQKILDDVYKRHATKISNKNDNMTTIYEFNNMHPVWSFIKVDNNFTIENEIKVPIIRENKCTTNCLTITLKDINKNKCIDSQFESAYIPKLIMEFVTGTLPKEIIAITFSKTITVHGKSNVKMVGDSNTRQRIGVYSLGYRIKLLTETSNRAILTKCKKYITNDFIINNSIDDKCVVSVSLPKFNNQLRK